MALAAGSRLGPYEVISPLGAGGMGEVYRARDTRLGRDVAVKVLPSEFTLDAERLKRFEREARAASALNHPNIVTIYDVGREGDTAYLAMEKIDGKSLRELIGASLPRSRVLDYASQTAGALAKAHAQGIVHRDLKPENIMVTRDGLVKILDFGLAKLVSPGSDSDRSSAPTEELTGTVPGSVMGTVGYMSPEQATGQPVDFRSDQFAFGAITLEMTTGRKAFAKPTAIETLSAILKEEPQGLDSSGLDAGLRAILDRCLAKSPDDRYDSTRDLARELASLRTRPADARSDPSAARSPRSFRTASLAGAIGLALGALAMFLWRGRGAAPEPPVIHELSYSGRDSSPSSSPDGKTVAFSSSRDGRLRIWLKQLSGGGEAPLTEGTDDNARFSPDGSAILFAHSGNGLTSLYSKAIVGGEPRKLVENAPMGDWSPDGRRIAFVRWTTEGGEFRTEVCVAAADGSHPKMVRKVPSRQLVFPRWSPDGSWIALSESVQGGARPSIVLVRADGEAIHELAPLRPYGTISALAWSKGGREILYSQSLSAVSAVGGSSSYVIAEDVRSGKTRKLLWTPSNAVTLEIGGPGRLLFDALPPRENLRQESLDRREPPRWWTRGNSSDRQPVYSPDGKSILFSSTGSGNLDLWTISTDTGALHRLTDDQAEDWDPAFSPDGKRILWSSNRSGHFEIWTASADGSGARQVSNDGNDAENPGETADGRWIVYSSGNPGHEGLWKIHPDGTEARKIVAEVARIPDISPDGRFVAFLTDRTIDTRTLRVVRLDDGKPTRFEIVTQLPLGEYQGVGVLGRARWMPSGKAIAFLGHDEAGNNGIYVQDFDPELDTHATRRKLAGFDPEFASESFAMSPDGKRITVAGSERISSVMVAEPVAGVEPPNRVPQ